MRTPWVWSTAILLSSLGVASRLGSAADAGREVERDIEADIKMNVDWAERAFGSGLAAPTTPSRLSLEYEEGLGDTKLGRCAFGTPMRLGEKTYTRGLGVNSRCVLRVSLDRPGSRFLADIGLDRNVDGTAASVTMHVAVEGHDIFATPVLRPDGSIRSIDVPLLGTRSFDLIVLDGGDGRGWDQADWADARVVLEDGTSLWLDDLARAHVSDAAPPFDFVYAGKPFREVLGDWESTLRDEEAGPGLRLRTWTLRDPKTKLEVRAEARIFTDTPGVDWTIHFSNRGTEDTPVLEKLGAVDVGVRTGLGATPVLHRLRGSTCAADDWRPFAEALARGKRIEFGAANGRSSADSPFFTLDWGSGGVTTAVGWSGQWRGSVEAGVDGGIHIRAGLERARLVLHPGETFRGPRILQLWWSGSDPSHGTNLFRRTFLAHFAPRIGGRPAVPPIAHLSTAFYEMNASTEPNVLSHLESIRGLGFEVFWLDAYWTRDGFPAGMGNYGFPLEVAEPRDRFPHGLASIGEHVHEAGLDFLLWFEPERVHPGTVIAREHPEWVISPGGDGSGLYDLGIPEAREHMTRYLNEAIRAYRIDVLRIDFNIDPLPFWEFLDRKDSQRIGMGEIRYVEGLYRMWDDVLAAHPRLRIDNCASGGRRIDLETCTRALPLWRSDNTCDMIDLRPETILSAAMKNQLMSAGLNRYLPYSTVGQMGTSPYLFRSGFNGGIAFAEDCRPADYPREALREAIEEAKRLRKYWSGDFHLLSEANLDPSAWCIFQYSLPDEGSGLVMAFRRHGSPYASFDCELRGIDPAADYSVWESQSYRRGEASTRKGSDLLRLRASIDEKPGSVIIEYEKRAP